MEQLRLGGAGPQALRLENLFEVAHEATKGRWLEASGRLSLRNGKSSLRAACHIGEGGAHQRVIRCVFVRLPGSGKQEQALRKWLEEILGARGVPGRARRGLESCGRLRWKKPLAVAS